MRIAVLGAGRIGSFRARVLSELPEVDEVIVGNRTVQRAEKLAREVGGTAGTIEEAIDSEPDAAFVSLATELHAEALHRCIDAGLPIFCEKPIALTLPETASVIEHADRAGNVLQIAFQRRLDPDCGLTERSETGAWGPSTASGSPPTTPSPPPRSL